jgi:hypothetical protein
MSRRRHWRCHRDPGRGRDISHLPQLQKRKKLCQLGLGEAPFDYHRNPFTGIIRIFQKDHASLRGSGHAEPDRNRRADRPFATVCHAGHCLPPGLSGANPNTVGVDRSWVVVATPAALVQTGGGDAPPLGPRAFRPHFPSQQRQRQLHGPMRAGRPRSQGGYTACFRKPGTASCNAR